MWLTGLIAKTGKMGCEDKREDEKFIILNVSWVLAFLTSFVTWPPMSAVRVMIPLRFENALYQEN